MSVLSSPLPVRRSLSMRWRDWSLATQFAVAGGVVMLIAMMLVGRWVSTRIEEAVVRNTANATAQYMESFISPLSQDLAKFDTLSPVARQALDEIFTNTPLGKRVVSFKIWKGNGLVVEASDKSIVGKTFEVDDDLKLAWSGQVAASFTAPFSAAVDAESAAERALGVPLLEIYSPIREVWSGKVIGVAEFYEVGTELETELRDARLNSWLAVALVMFLIGASLYAIVLRGSRTIDMQRAALTNQLHRLTELSEHNTALRRRVQNAAARASAQNDQSLRQVGADLHDGPAQLMGFAALRLDAIRGVVADPAAKADLTSVESAVKDAIKELRTIARGLSLPQIEQRPLDELVRSLTVAHAARTETSVEVVCTLPPDRPFPPAVKICIYRFVQEGLNNAWRHAAGVGQKVELTLNGGVLTLTVSDKGPGFAAAPDTATDTDTATGTDTTSGTATTPAVPVASDGSGMGLSGLQDRVESLGGSFERLSPPGGGAAIRMTLDMKDG